MENNNISSEILMRKYLDFTDDEKRQLIEQKKQLAQFIADYYAPDIMASMVDSALQGKQKAQQYVLDRSLGRSAGKLEIEQNIQIGLTPELIQARKSEIKLLEQRIIDGDYTAIDDMRQL